MSATSPDDKENGSNAAVRHKPQREFNIFRRLWAAIRPELPLLIAMLKGSLPPIIAMAAYQSSAWSTTFSTLGYLVSIVAFLGFAIAPRGKFLQSLVLNLLFTCAAAAIALLQILVTVSARKSTTTDKSQQYAAPGSSGSMEALDYNASANTLSALGLFITVYLVNTYVILYSSVRRKISAHAIGMRLTFHRRAAFQIARRANSWTDF